MFFGWGYTMNDSANPTQIMSSIEKLWREASASADGTLQFGNTNIKQLGEMVADAARENAGRPMAIKTEEAMSRLRATAKTKPPHPQNKSSSGAQNHDFDDAFNTLVKQIVIDYLNSSVEIMVRDIVKSEIRNFSTSEAKPWKKANLGE